MQTNAADKPTGPLVWNLVLPYGKWDGREGQEYGPAEGAAMIEYFNRSHKANGRPLLIDYEHRSLDGVEAPASGWIWDLQEFPNADPPGVYMLNEWTPRAKQAIEANEYKYLSPVIAEGYEDPVTGEKVPWCLFNAALTNSPFMFDKMPSVKAASLTANNNGIQNAKTLNININGDTMDAVQQLIDAFLAKLGAPPGMAKEEFLKLADGFGKVTKVLETLESVLGTQEGAAPAEGAAPTETPPAEMTPEVAEEMAQKMTNSIKALQAKAKSADEAASYLAVNHDALTKTIIGMKGNGDTVPRAEFDAQVNRLKAMEATAFMAKNESKIPPAKREWFKNKAIQNLDEAQELVDVLIEGLPAKETVTVDKNSNAPDPLVLRGLQPKEAAYYLNSLGIPESEHKQAILNANKSYKEGTK